MSYDPKCLQLASDFLWDHQSIRTVENIERLAQAIQTTIEDWIETKELWEQNKN